MDTNHITDAPCLAKRIAQALRDLQVNDLNLGYAQVECLGNKLLVTDFYTGEAYWVTVEKA